ncbi:hypothetical protein [Timonella senegalensis]|uniref:hypothetical protein n=1 Tax=Timonella senegalensis TaxID=1465825 RepID=UPI002FDE0566
MDVRPWHFYAAGALLFGIGTYLFVTEHYILAVLTVIAAVVVATEGEDIYGDWKKYKDERLRIAAEFEARANESKQSLLTFQAELDAQYLARAEREAAQPQRESRAQPNAWKRTRPYVPPKPHLPTIKPTQEPIGRGRKIAGFGFYKDNARKLVGITPDDKRISKQFDATLRTNSANPFDYRAVAIFVRKTHIGYLPAERADEWFDYLAELEEKGFHLSAIVTITAVNSPEVKTRALIKMPELESIQIDLPPSANNEPTALEQSEPN